MHHPARLLQFLSPLALVVFLGCRADDPAKRADPDEPDPTTDEPTLAEVACPVSQPPVFNAPVHADLLGVDHPDAHHVGHGRDIQHAANRMGDGSVLPHSGQVFRDEVDLALRGRDAHSDLVIARRHLSRRVQEGSPFGPAWAFNYRHTLQELPDGDLLHHSFGREDRFHRDGENWVGGHGRFEHIVWSPDDSDVLLLRRPGGEELEFAVAETEAGIEGLLVRIVSPNRANALTLGYEDAVDQPDLLSRRLLTITDAYGRSADLSYEHPDRPDLVTHLVGPTGREVTYTYDADGMLIEARLPAVTSTAGLNDFPDGIATQYRYVDADSPAAPALTAVVFPNEVAAGSGTAALSWTYLGEVSDNRLSGFVASHTAGAGDVGGTWTYAHTLVPPDESLSGLEEIEVEVVDRRDTVTDLRFTCEGQMLEETVHSQGYRDGGADLHTRSYTFDDDGDVVGTVDVAGNISTHEHADTEGQHRSADAHETARTWAAGPLGGDQASIRLESLQEPLFNHPLRQVDARGSVTVTLYDWMEDVPAALEELAPRMGLTPEGLRTQLEDDGVIDALREAGAGVDGPVDLNGDGVTDQRGGNLVLRYHPAVELPEQATWFGLQTAQTAQETWAWNEYGQEIRHVDPEGNVTLRTYHSATDPAGLSDASAGDGGFLRSLVEDAEAGADRNSGHDPSPVERTLLLSYRPQGDFPANERGMPTAWTDGRGVVTTFLVDELDRTVVTVRASEAPQGLEALAHRLVALRDANGNIVESQRPLADDSEAYIATTFAYDILDQRIEQVDDAGGSEEVFHHWSYDASGNTIEARRGVGTAAESVERWTWDERDLWITHTRGADTQDETTTTSVVDESGNIAGTIDADGDLSLTVYDGYHRVKREIDRAGNQVVLTYDAGGAVVARSWQDAAGLELARTETSFDARGRAYREDQLLFHLPNGAVGTLDDGALEPGDGRVTTIRVFDRAGRAVGRVDADADAFETRFDGLGRILETIDPLDNRIEFFPDPEGNVTQQIRVETAPELVTEETFTTTWTHDALGRPTSRTDPGGRTTLTAWDARGNEVLSTDALGNEVERDYDRLDRLVEQRTWLSVDATGASAANHDITQAGDGRITVQSGWDALGRLVSQVDDNGNETTYMVDTLGRRTRAEHPDGSVETWTWSGDNELIDHVTRHGAVVTWTHDPEGRPLSASTDHSGASTPLIGSVSRTWTYDGKGRVVQSTDGNDPNLAQDDVTLTKVYDSLGRVLRETQEIGGAEPMDVDTQWQGAMRRTALTYPEVGAAPRRQVTRTYDALDRVATIEGDPALHHNAEPIAAYEYVGPSRDLRVTYANGATRETIDPSTGSTLLGFEAGYDDAGRPVRLAWTGLVSWESTWSDVNRRTSQTRTWSYPGAVFSPQLDTWSLDSSQRIFAFDRDLHDDAAASFKQGKIVQYSSRTLDGADNMTSFQDEGQLVLMQLDSAANRYDSIDGAARSFDAASSLVDDGAFTYAYDAQGRAVEVTTAAGLRVLHLLYDAEGRVALHEATDPLSGANTVHRRLWSGWNLVEEPRLDDAAGWVPHRSFVTGRDLDDHVQIVDANHGPLYLHADAQDSVGLVTGPVGEPLEVVTYSMLGRPSFFGPDGAVRDASAVDNPYLFHGRRYLAELEAGVVPGDGRYDFRRRWYDPGLGRFQTVDPLGSWNHGQGNGLSAFSEDPWNQRDPMGEADLNEFAEQLSNMTVAEMNELARILKDEHGIEPAAAAAAAAAGAAEGALPPTQEIEKSEYDVILVNAGGSMLGVVKLVKSLTGLGLKEAKEIVDSAPTPVKEAVSKDVAEGMKTQLQEAGGTVELR